MTAHAPLPLSGAAAWVACAQWAAMNKQYGGQESPESLEGSAAHVVLAEMLAGRNPGDEVMVGQTPVAVTDEMLEGAELFVEDVRKTVGAAWVDTRLADPAEREKRGSYLYVESRIKPVLHEHCWGTPDAWLRTDGKTYLWDYKFGHKRVDAENNWQAVGYLASIMGRRPDPCEIRIVQPRNYEPGGPVRVWRPTEDDLLAAWSQLKAAADRAMATNRTATVGEQCQYCPGRHACTALQEASNNIMSAVAQPAATHDLPDYQAGRELVWAGKAALLLEARRSGLEAQVMAAYRRGDRSTGWVLQRSTGRRVWDATPEAVKGLGLMIGVDLFHPPKPFTPTQAIKAGVPEQLVTPMTKQQAGSEKLVLEANTTARRAFFKE